jgi:hypothetical protein
VAADTATKPRQSKPDRASRRRGPVLSFGAGRDGQRPSDICAPPSTSCRPGRGRRASTRASTPPAAGRTLGTQPRPERLTFSQTSSHGVVRGHRGAFEPKCSPKIQKSPQHGPSRRCGDGRAPSSCRFPYPSWVSPMPSIHGPRIATIRWFARLAGGRYPGDAGRCGVIARGGLGRGGVNAAAMSFWARPRGCSPVRRGSVRPVRQ